MDIPFALKLMRFDRPIGILLLLWPTYWAIWLSKSTTTIMPNLKILLIFTLGVIVMRAAGCVINDIADRKLDQHVARTKTRPLANGDLTTKQAMILFIILISFAAILVLQLNKLCLNIAIIMASITILYPFCKRITNFPQFVLSICFASGTLMAYAATHNQLPLEAWLLYLATASWIVAFDTQYALCDIKDDQKIGIKSTAITFGKQVNNFILSLQIIAISCLLYLGKLKSFGGLYFIIISTSIILLIYQYRLTATKRATNCLQAFLNNNYLGILIFIAVLLGVYG